MNSRNELVITVYGQFNHENFDELLEESSLSTAAARKNQAQTPPEIYQRVRDHLRDSEVADCQGDVDDFLLHLVRLYSASEDAEPISSGQVNIAFSTGSWMLRRMLPWFWDSSETPECFVVPSFWEVEQGPPWSLVEIACDVRADVVPGIMQTLLDEEVFSYLRQDVARSMVSLCFDSRTPLPLVILNACASAVPASSYRDELADAFMNIMPTEPTVLPAGSWLKRTEIGPGSTDFVALELATGSPAVDGGVVQLWDARTGSRVMAWAVAFSSDDGWLATGDSDGDVQIWNLRGGTLISAAHRDRMHGVEFSPDLTMRIWDAGTGTILTLSPGLGSHDGAAVVATTAETAVAPEIVHLIHPDALVGAVRLWDFGDQGTRPAYGIPDMFWFVTNSADLTMRIWDAGTGTVLTLSPVLGHHDRAAVVATTAETAVREIIPPGALVEVLNDQAAALAITTETTAQEIIHPVTRAGALIETVDGDGLDWEYQPLRLPREVARRAMFRRTAATQLAVQAEFAGWKLSRVRMYLDGTRTVLLRRQRTSLGLFRHRRLES